MQPHNNCSGKNDTKIIEWCAFDDLFVATLTQKLLEDSRPYNALKVVIPVDWL